MYRQLSLLGFALVMLSLTTGSHAAPRVYKSQAQDVRLIELYTSQGCYSCPPAEAWLNKFAQSDVLWTQIIPINFHVDYWDHLGWKDPFARPEFTKRQGLYQRYGHTGHIATPGFVVSGKGWNGWFSGRQVSEAPAQKLSGQLMLSLEQEKARVSYQATGSENILYAHLAILGMGTETSIPKGENAGKTLVHDFVVIGYDRVRLVSSDKQWQVQMRRPAELKRAVTRKAVVAWVSRVEDPAPVQVLGGWLE